MLPLSMVVVQVILITCHCKHLPFTTFIPVYVCVHVDREREKKSEREKINFSFLCVSTFE